MGIHDLKNLFKFEFDEDKKCLIKNISILELRLILEYFGIYNESEHDVYVHRFKDWNSTETIFKNGLKSFGSYNLQSTLHLLPSTEHFAEPYNENLCSYCGMENAIIGVIPECVGNLYLGKSDRLSSNTFSAPRYCTDVPFIYSCSGNQNIQYCPYDAMANKNHTLVPELILGAIKYIGQPFEDFEQLNKTEKLFTIEINPKFVLFFDYVQENGLSNLETLRRTIKQNLEDNVYVDYFDLNKELSEDLIGVIQILKNPEFLKTREEYVLKRNENGLSL